MTEPARIDGRVPDALREISIETGIQRHAAGSCIIRWGHTHVLCAATLEDRVPPFRIESGGGWVTAEYGMLPASTNTRILRKRAAGSGRTQEISRLIGRSLRAVVDLDKLGPRTLTVDCDVLQADGGTRCASITGAWVAIALALAEGKTLRALPPQIAAVSLGVLGGQVLTDLCYEEDSAADVDLNFVTTKAGIVEIQGTAEGAVFSADTLARMVSRGQAACARLMELQREAVISAGVMP